MDSRPVPMGLFPQGNQLDSPYFSGRVWLSMLVDDASPLQCPIGHVTFEPGCRNNWHSHPGGQILLVTGGAGLYQERGQAARALHPGDTVCIAPDVEHWHGAAPDAWFAHLAITTQSSLGPAVWLESVSDDAYAEAARPVSTAGQAPRLSETAVRKLNELLSESK